MTKRSFCCKLPSLIEGFRIEEVEEAQQQREEITSVVSMGERKHVLRCPECEARVALERDLLVLNEVSSSVRIGRFKTVANVKREGDFANCARCGSKLFALELVQSDHELVLRYDAQDVFTASPLRILTLTRAFMNYFYTHERKLKDPNEEFVPGKKRERTETYTFNLALPGTGALEDIVAIGEMEEHLGTEVEQRNMLWLRGASKQHASLCERLLKDLGRSRPQLVEKIEASYPRYDMDTFQTEIFAGRTYDLVLISELDRGVALSWSGPQNREMEELLVASWITSGGNVLLAQWGRPWHSSEVGANVDVDRLIKSLKSHESRSTNRQDVLLRLMEHGQYLAWWDEEDRLPGYARERVRGAMRCPIHASWQFKRDLLDGVQDAAEQSYYRASRANDIVDPYEERSRSLAIVDDADRGSGVFNLVVRKSSRTLYDVYKVLEDGWTKIVQSISTA